VRGAVRDALAACSGVPRGARVALAVGSRGIGSIGPIVSEIVGFLRERGNDPFIVPAMGSHGGATAEGQAGRLAVLGVDATSTGAEVRSTLDVVRVGTAPSGMPLWMDAAAIEADAIVPVNRVKPHTAFSGAFGSGLAKMLMVGIGNREGAVALHREAAGRTFEALVREALPVLLAAVPVPFGVALVEDAYHDVAIVEAVEGERILDREPELLRVAGAWMASLPVAEVDLLIVDEMSKTISGQGMDPIVTGRKGGEGTARVLRLFVRDLAADAEGNAHGVGQADATTRRFVERADWAKTWVNTFTSGNLDRGRIPPHFDSDREAIEALLATVGRRAPGDARVVRIRNTLTLDVVEISGACRDALVRPDAVTVLAGPYPMTFDATGTLRPPAP